MTCDLPLASTAVTASTRPATAVHRVGQETRAQLDPSPWIDGYTVLSAVPFESIGHRWHWLLAQHGGRWPTARDGRTVGTSITVSSPNSA